MKGLIDAVIDYTLAGIAIALFLGVVAVPFVSYYVHSIGVM